MVEKKWTMLAVAGFAMVLAAPVIAQSAPPAVAPMKADASDKADATDATDATPAIDANAMTALHKMGAALRALEQFSFEATTTQEVVLDSGEKIQFDGHADWKVKQPNDLYVEVNSDRKQRQYFYDGKDLSIFSPRLDLYTTIKSVNADLQDFVLKASNEYGIELPLTDLFFWGTKYISDDVIKSAMVVGPGTIDGEKIDQYAFRQEGVDWQVWISQSTSLPRKLVITTLDDKARPQYTARLNWNTKATFPDSTFDFVAPKGAHPIEFKPDVAAAEGDEGEGS